jgi:hypothetical protein
MMEARPGYAVRVRKLVAAGGLVAGLVAVAGCGSGGVPAVSAADRVGAHSAAGTASLAAVQARRSLKCAVRVNDRHPVIGSSVGVRVSSVPGAWVKVVARYGGGSRRKSARAGIRGRRLFWYGTSAVAPGYRVRVVVRVSRHHRRGVCSAWFTPRQRTATPHPTGTPSPSPSVSPSKTAVPSPSPSPSPGRAWCTATASVYDASRNWNDVYVYSNQPDTTATATADGWSGHYETNDSGYADVWLDGPPPGVEITVRVGGATCTTSD